MAQFETALSIVQQASLTASSPALLTNTSTLFDPTSQTSATWLNALKQATNGLMNYQTDRYFDTLIRQQELVNVSTDAAFGVYDLPIDFYRIVFVQNGGTQYQRFNASDFNFSGMPIFGNSYCIRNNKIVAFPPLPTVTCRYISDGVFVPFNDGDELDLDFSQGSYMPSSDSDLAILPSPLMIAAVAFFYAQTKGLNNLEVLKENYLEELSANLATSNQTSPFIIGTFGQSYGLGNGRIP